MEKMLTAMITSSSVIPAFEFLFFFLSNCMLPSLMSLVILLIDRISIIYLSTRFLSHIIKKSQRTFFLYKNTDRGALYFSPLTYFPLLCLFGGISRGCCILRLFSSLTVCRLAVSTSAGSILVCGVVCTLC